ncbi:MAG: peptide ABC transporter substrate-binding protein, partial [Opitutales bacterium]|nr:peptide ABC transporter substrate-binding protein [Opitutales bacterium]
ARVSVLRERGDAALRLDPYFSTAFIRVNCTHAPLDDVRVRRALSLALDRDVLAYRVMRAGETPADTLVPVSGDSREKVPEQREAELREACRLLAEAGYPDGKNFPEISYLFNTSDGAQFFAQAIQEMWRKNLGIKVALKNQEYKVYRVSMEQGDYDLARSAWSGDFLDPTTFLDLFAGTSNMNWTGWQSTDYDRLLAEASRERDTQKRAEKLRAAEKILLDAVPVIPTVNNRNKFLIRPAVRGWFPNLLDIHPYNRVWLESGK